MTPTFPLVATAVNFQLPVRRLWKPAQELLLTPSGTWYMRTLPTGEYYEWHLQFAGLTWEETQALITFHTDMMGAYHCFRFCDPLRNLLAWSEDQTQSVWATSSNLIVSLFPSPTADVMQGAQIVNQSNTEGLISQSVGCAPTFPYSIATTVRSSRGGAIGLLIGSQRRDFTLGTTWQTMTFSAVPGGTIDQVTFTLALPAGGECELAGVQADFGAVIPEYKRSEERQGLFTKARFKHDELIVSCTEAGLFSAVVTVIASAEE